MLHDPALLKATTANLEYMPEQPGYIYFEPGPQRSVLLDAAEASMLAYARYPARRLAQPEFTRILGQSGLSLIRTFGDFFADNASTGRGFFAANDERALLAFRGTEADNFCDVLADGDLLLMPDERIHGRGALVHRGFQRYLRSLWPKVEATVDGWRHSHPNGEICITGHSLGAALATLAFAYLADPGTSLYTFGCPRVGNKPFSSQIEEAALRQPCFRVVDNKDLVTHVPLALGNLAYVHPSIPVLWIDGNGAMIENPSPPLRDAPVIGDVVTWYAGKLFRKLHLSLPGPLADHSPVRYCHWIAQNAP